MSIARDVGRLIDTAVHGVRSFLRSIVWGIGGDPFIRQMDRDVGHLWRPVDGDPVDGEGVPGIVPGREIGTTTRDDEKQR
jgi:hypothetical protein